MMPISQARLYWLGMIFFFFDINDLPLIEKIISLETKPSTHFPLTNQSWDTFEHARKLWIEGSVGTKGGLTTTD
jgi:hypothetical protein